MRLVFMVEERSMKEMLEGILPKILPEDYERPLIIPHNGKHDLTKSIPIKLRAWQKSNDKFIIVHDQDNNDCIQLKSELISLCDKSRNEHLIRIVCTELESWYFGDLKAVSLAYEKDYTPLAAKRKYRTPDIIKNAKIELRKIIPAYQPIDGAKRISMYMDVNNNTSHSFNVFVNGVKKLCCISDIAT